LDLLFTVVEPLDQLLSLEASDVGERPQLLLTEVAVVSLKHFPEVVARLLVLAALLLAQDALVVLYLLLHLPL